MAVKGASTSAGRVWYTVQRLLCRLQGVESGVCVCLEALPMEMGVLSIAALLPWRHVENYCLPRESHAYSTRQVTPHMCHCWYVGVS